MVAMQEDGNGNRIQDRGILVLVSIMIVEEQNIILHILHHMPMALGHLHSIRA
jgi:hypothetical protein